MNAHFDSNPPSKRQRSVSSGSAATNNSGSAAVRRVSFANASMTSSTASSDSVNDRIQHLQSSGKPLDKFKATMLKMKNTNCNLIEKALQPSLETAIDLFLSEFPSLISSYQLAVERKKKLSAPDYTPRSILTKLKLTGSDPEVEESDDFISLTRQFEATKLRAQTEFTNGFIAVAELNCNVALKRIHSKLHDFTCKIAIAHLTMHTTLSGKELLVKLGKELVHNLYENYSGLDDNKQFAKTICEELKLDVNKWLDMKVIPATDYTPIKTTENIDEAVWSEAEIGVKRIIRLFGSALKEMNIRSDLKEKEKAILQYIEEDAVIEKGEEMAVEFEKTNTDQAALEMITSLTKKVTQLEKLTKNQSVKEGRGANNNSASLKKQKAKKLAEKKARAKAKKEKARNQRSNSQERRNSDTASSNDTNNGNSSSNNRNKNRNRNNGNNQGNRSRSRQQKK